MRGRRLQQQLARLGAGAAQRIEVSLHGQAAGRIEHVLEERVAVRLVVEVDRLNLHLVPVGIQFVGKNQRQRR